MIRVTSRLVSIVAAATSTVLWTISTDKRAIVKKIWYNNRTGVNTQLRIGYIDVVAAAFQQCTPDILMVAGFDGQITEDELPIFGNTPEGFVADAAVAAGCTGVIVAQSVAAGAAPLDVQVVIEVEEI